MVFIIKVIQLITCNQDSNNFPYNDRVLSNMSLSCFKYSDKHKPHSPIVNFVKAVIPSLKGIKSVLSVCPSVSTFTAEPYETRSWNSAWTLPLTKLQMSSKEKVIGHKHDFRLSTFWWCDLCWIWQSVWSTEIHFAMTYDIISRRARHRRVVNTLAFSFWKRTDPHIE